MKRPSARIVSAWITAALALAVIGAHCAVIRPWMPDDAFISFRYAESFATGQGIVFNPAERVEGYTSFLWVVLLALGHRLGCDTVVLAKLLSAAFSAATVLLLLNAHRFVRPLDRRSAPDRGGARTAGRAGAAEGSGGGEDGSTGRGYDPVGSSGGDSRAGAQGGGAWGDSRRDDQDCSPGRDGRTGDQGVRAGGDGRAGDQISAAGRRGGLDRGSGNGVRAIARWGGGIPSMAVLMLASCGVFTPWARSGMEVTLFTFLVLLSALLYLSVLHAGEAASATRTAPGAAARPPRHARASWRQARRLCAPSVACALAALTRPEGCLVLAVIATFEISRHWARARGTPRESSRPWLAGALPGVTCLIGPFASLYLPYFVWRYAHYGFLLPNTFYVKVGFHPRQVLRGFRYGMGFAAVAALILTPILVWLLTRKGADESAARDAGRADDPDRIDDRGRLKIASDAGALPGGGHLPCADLPSGAGYLPGAGALPDANPMPGSGNPSASALGLLIFLAGVYAAYILAVGGDVLAAYRFFAPIMPLLCLASAICAARIFQKRSLAPFVLVAFLYNLVQLNVGYGIHLHLVNDRVALEGKEVGLWLRDHAPSGSVLAVNVAGSIPYYSRLVTIDMLGLNDVHIAHRQVPRFGGGMPGHEKGDGAYVLSREPAYIQFGASLGSKEPVFLGDREIAADARFRDLYVMETHALASGKTFVIYRRR